MAKGIVYILTNPSLDGWVKIGMSDRSNIEDRLAEPNTKIERIVTCGDVLRREIAATIAETEGVE